MNPNSNNPNATPPLSPQPQQPVQEPTSPFFAADASAQPAPGQATPAPTTAAPLPRSPRRFSKKLLIGIIGGVVVISAVIALLVASPWSLIGSNASIENTTSEIIDSNAFFAPEKPNGLYALFDSKKEKRLTEYAFVRASNFVNGSAVVENEAEEMGVINDDGSMSIEFGTYDGIKQSGTLYMVGNKDDELPQLVTANNKKVSIPGGAAAWDASTNDNNHVNINTRPWSYASTKIHPVITVEGVDGGEDTTYVLTFNGKEIFSTTESITQRIQYNSIYTVFGGKDTTYVVDSKAGKLVAEIEGKSNTLTPAEGTLMVLGVGGSITNNESYVFIKDGKKTGELPGSSCRTVTIQTLPSDGSQVLFCEGKDKDLDKLLNSDGSTIAEGSLFYTKDTYVAHQNETLTFYKEGKSVATVKNCRSWTTLNGESFTATAAYPVEADCDKSINGVNYAVYSTDGTLLKNGGNEWYLGATRFTKDGLGVAMKKSGRLGSRDAGQGYVVSTSLETKAGPFNDGDFISVDGVIYFVSTSAENTTRAVYSGDLTTALYEGSASMKLHKRTLSIAEINDKLSLYSPIEGIILMSNDTGTFDVFDPATKTTASSGIARSAPINVYKTYFTAENEKNVPTYYYLSGNPVKS